MTAMPVVGVAGSFGSFDHIAENAGKYVRAVHPAPPTRARNAATTARRRSQGPSGSKSALARDAIVRINGGLATTLTVAACAGAGTWTTGLWAAGIGAGS
jgi:alkanesulfonate monooxygenase SsuD/methylene tetrahydromethanopterin reductase-like flavin-dependent oxidoreductase (luciferase family)